MIVSCDNFLTMDFIISGSNESSTDFQKGKEFTCIDEVRNYMAGWALQNRIPYFSKNSCPKEFQTVCPEVKSLTRKKVECEKKCPFYIAAYTRRNTAMVKFAKGLVIEHAKNCSTRKRSVTTRALKEYVTPLCNFMRDVGP